ncbi:MAG: cupin domain-containing protein [Pseudoxanthomonas sp.]
MRIHSLTALFALLFCACAAAQDHSHAATAPLPSVTQVTAQALPEFPGKEIVLLSVEYPPGGADPVHRHDAHALVYVLEGSIVMGVEGGKEVTLTPGQTFHEGPKDLHTVGRNASKTAPAKFLAFLIKDVDKPAFVPVE